MFCLQFYLTRVFHRYIFVYISLKLHFCNVKKGFTAPQQAIAINPLRSIQQIISSYGKDNTDICTFASLRS